VLGVAAGLPNENPANDDAGAGVEAGGLLDPKPPNKGVAADVAGGCSSESMLESLSSTSFGGC